ncbi:hypothetical protein GWI33_016544 [Rhynchophorus ferrugineus]|uniref:Uncharacterized protein n=1 Tax=Rhynchophorus ferrugineus TaxID=354439 RepID=A0A834M391_RHYFE|nr:hypothetical protein GWI33_016544 [Rhynchophorus ferrugineus]
MPASEITRKGNKAGPVMPRAAFVPAETVLCRGNRSFRVHFHVDNVSKGPVSAHLLCEKLDDFLMPLQTAWRMGGDPGAAEAYAGREFPLAGKLMTVSERHVIE